MTTSLETIHAMTLIGAHEIRASLGVTRQRTYQITSRDDFPEPVAQLAQGKIWDKLDVDRWIADHRGNHRLTRKNRLGFRLGGSGG